MKATDLKPCPFCGGEAELFTARTENYGYWPCAVAVRCTVCRTRTQSFSDENHVIGPEKIKITAEKYASAMWNRRFTKREND